MRRSIAFSTLVLAASVVLFPAGAKAQDLEEGGKLYTIQNRKYVLAHEFTIGVGLIPVDAFYKGVTGSFGYTYHFSDLVGWEIIGATYSLNYDTSLRKDLETNFNVRPTKFPELHYFFESNIVLKPLYGKMVYLNDTLIYGELFTEIGPSVAKYDNGNGTYIGADVGLGLRLFLSKSFAVRFEIRDYEFFSSDRLADNKNELFLQVGFGLNIR